MTYSPLTNQVRAPKGKWSSRKGLPKRKVIAHHWAGKYGGIERLVDSTDRVSANYIILSDGTLIGSVSEAFRAWTSGSFSADGDAITVEMQNSTLGPEWRVSPAALRTFEKLTADIAKRYGWTQITRTQVRGHREFAATACPGPYVYPQLTQLAANANALLKGTIPTTPSKPTLPPTPVPSTPKPSKLWPANSLVVDGNFSYYSALAYQTMLKRIGHYTGTLDGAFGPMTIEAEQRWLKSLGYYKGAIDRKRGPLTVKALQSFLKSKGYYAGKVDGWFGPLAAEGLQRYINSQRTYFA